MVMRVFRLFIVIISASMVVWWLNIPFLESKQDPSAPIVTSTPILKDLVKNIMGPDINIVSLTEPGAAPVNQAISQEKIAQLTMARVFILNEDQPFIKELAPHISDKTIVINISNLLKKIKVWETYYWMSTSKYITVIETLQKELKKIYPKRRSEINYRKSAYVKTIFSLNESMRMTMSSRGSIGETIVSNHESFSPMARELGFDFLAFDFSQTLNEAVLSDMLNNLKEKNVKILYPNDAISQSGINKLVKFAITQDWPLVIAQPIITLNLDVSGSGIETYIQLIEYNFRTISDS